MKAGASNDAETPSTGEQSWGLSRVSSLWFTQQICINTFVLWPGLGHMKGLALMKFGEIDSPSFV